MKEKVKYNWENDRFQKDPFRVPDGYFAGFQDRMMDRIHQEKPDMEVVKGRLVKPWMVWISGIAAALVIGWFGIRTYYLTPLYELRFQEEIALMVDYYGEELHEGQLAGFLTDNKIEVGTTEATEVDEFIQIDPDLAEQYIYESIGF